MRRPTRSTSGFSMVEVLVAALIFGIIALGLLPLFTRSIRSNVEGFDYTQVSNFAKSRAEEYLQFPFNSARLTPDPGDEALVVTDYFSDENHEWVGTEPTAPYVALFTRTTTVRQFGVADLVNPLPGNASIEAIHLKEITVEVEAIRPTILGSGKDIAVRVLKSQ